MFSLDPPGSSYSPKSSICRNWRLQTDLRCKSLSLVTCPGRPHLSPSHPEAAGRGSSQKRGGLEGWLDGWFIGVELIKTFKRTLHMSEVMAADPNVKFRFTVCLSIPGSCRTFEEPQAALMEGDPLQYLYKQIHYK